MCSPQVMASVRQQLAASRQLTRRSVISGTVAATAAAGLFRVSGAAQSATPVASPAVSGASRVVDLTHLMSPDIPIWPGNEPFAAEVLVTVEEDGFYAQKLTFWEHTGTHVDAPAHFDADGETAEHLPVENFLAPLAVIDISGRAAEDSDTALTVEDIETWEAEFGPLPHGAFVAMFSGWGDKFGDPAAFVNLDNDGVQHYPGFHPDAAAFLVEQRSIVGIGVDTLSQDPGNSTDFGTHLTILGAGKYGVEGIASLDQVPALGATIVVGAPKHLNASGGPARVLALV
jgi:kynurenine formamidase